MIEKKKAGLARRCIIYNSMLLFKTGNGSDPKTTCNIGDEGAVILSEALKTNTSLTELYLRSRKNKNNYNHCERV